MGRTAYSLSSEPNKIFWCTSPGICPAWQYSNVKLLAANLNGWRIWSCDLVEHANVKSVGFLFSFPTQAQSSKGWEYLRLSIFWAWDSPIPSASQSGSYSLGYLGLVPLCDYPVERGFESGSGGVKGGRDQSTKDAWSRIGLVTAWTFSGAEFRELACRVQPLSSIASVSSYFTGATK